LSRRIPQELIDDIRAANDIVDVIGERIPIKKAGRNYKAVCPFHQEKTPSFNINPERQIYHCFGCGAGGNVISFVMEHDKVGFLDAVRELASRAGIKLPERVGRFGDESDDPIYGTNALAMQYFRRCLASDRGEAAREYCMNRGLTEEVMEEFRIGYAPPGWDGLTKAAKKEGVSETVLEEAGLVIRRDGGGVYDRFRDRLIFPLLLTGGRAIGFGGRALGDQEPKYLNSPETRVYRKSYFLYGLAQAMPALRASREAILVEGYTDLISLHEAGFANAVASAGTALTPQQAKAMSRYADKVFVLYDGDSAGIQAATRAAETLVQLGLKVRVAMLPEGVDPDTFVRKRGAEALKDELEGSLDFIDFYVAANPPASPEDRESAARGLIETVARIEDALKADLMLEKIGQALSIGRGAVTRAYEAKKAEDAARRKARASDAASGDPGPTGSAGSAGAPGATPGTARAGGAAGRRGIEGAALAAQKGLLVILLQGGDAAALVAASVSPEDFEDPTLRNMAERLLSAPTGEPVDVSALVGEVEDAAMRAVLTELSVVSTEGRDGGRLCDDYIRTVRKTKIEVEIRSVERLIRTAEMTDDQNELLTQVARRQELARQLSDLSTER